LTLKTCALDRSSPNRNAEPDAASGPHRSAGFQKRHPDFRPNGAPVVRGNASSKKKGPVSASNSKENRAVDWSGRQDLKLEKCS
jgi:hypothetical protein